MLVTTTPILEGKKIIEYKGPVFAQVVRGFAIGQGFLDGLRAVVADRSKGHEELISQIRTEALNELEQKARDTGANALVGVVVDVEAVSLRERPMILGKASGTAVTVE